MVSKATRESVRRSEASLRRATINTLSGVKDPRLVRGTLHGITPKEQNIILARFEASQARLQQLKAETERLGRTLTTEEREALPLPTRTLSTPSGQKVASAEARRAERRKEQEREQEQAGQEPTPTPSVAEIGVEAKPTRNISDVGIIRSAPGARTSFRRVPEADRERFEEMSQEQRQEFLRTAPARPFTISGDLPSSRLVTRVKEGAPTTVLQQAPSVQDRVLSPKITPSISGGFGASDELIGRLTAPVKPSETGLLGIGKSFVRESKEFGEPFANLFGKLESKQVAVADSLVQLGTDIGEKDVPATLEGRRAFQLSREVIEKKEAITKRETDRLVKEQTDKIKAKEKKSELIFDKEEKRLRKDLRALNKRIKAGELTESEAQAILDTKVKASENKVRIAQNQVVFQAQRAQKELDKFTTPDARGITKLEERIAEAQNREIPAFDKTIATLGTIPILGIAGAQAVAGETIKLGGEVLGGKKQTGKALAGIPTAVALGVGKSFVLEPIETTAEIGGTALLGGAISKASKVRARGKALKALEKEVPEVIAGKGEVKTVVKTTRGKGIDKVEAGAGGKIDVALKIGEEKIVVTGRTAKKATKTGTEPIVTRTEARFKIDKIKKPKKATPENIFDQPRKSLGAGASSIEGFETASKPIAGKRRISKVAQEKKLALDVGKKKQRRIITQEGTQFGKTIVGGDKLKRIVSVSEQRPKRAVSRKVTKKSKTKDIVEIGERTASGKIKLTTKPLPKDVALIKSRGTVEEIVLGSRRKARTAQATAIEETVVKPKESFTKTEVVKTQAGKRRIESVTFTRQERKARITDSQGAKLKRDAFRNIPELGKSRPVPTTKLVVKERAPALPRRRITVDVTRRFGIITEGGVSPKRVIRKATGKIKPSPQAITARKKFIQETKTAQAKARQQAKQATVTKLVTKKKFKPRVKSGIITERQQAVRDVTVSAETVAPEFIVTAKEAGKQGLEGLIRGKQFKPTVSPLIGAKLGVSTVAGRRLGTKSIPKLKTGALPKIKQRALPSIKVSQQATPAVDTLQELGQKQTPIIKISQVIKPSTDVVPDFTPTPVPIPILTPTPPPVPPPPPPTGLFLPSLGMPRKGKGRGRRQPKRKLKFTQTLLGLETGARRKAKTKQVFTGFESIR